ncbi:sulfonate transport system permease protein [Paraburkholderia eburnea]|uniref:Sulfonate transport system permease protein n=1 Tax=Paraburkholderia eburnea TaxID=1189126 RepID=A0A2S4MA40_9BURK|nr:ABC transporter permease subunit [Paraburkholderia eburnea]POR51554.1 sulfonate transport system permease protein [Paraburkholderia eburnea]PRZ22585.1 sulfonate transport system permease protein [Paraburkholderia eburnea]
MADVTSSSNHYIPSSRGGLRLSKDRVYYWLSWAIPVLIVVIWELAARVGWIEPQVLPAPSSVAVTAWNLARNGDLFVHLGVSLLRAACGFLIGGAIGLALGVLVGFSQLAQALIDRSIQMVRAIPFLAMLPLVIVWFGVGEGAKIFLVALAVLFPVYINTMLGIRQIDPKLMELAKVIGMKWPAVVRRIILPGAMPAILTGVRYALAHAWLALVIAETLATTKGIGFLAMDAREFLQTNVILLTMIIYAIIGVIADALVRSLEARFLSWHANYTKGEK